MILDTDVLIDLEKKRPNALEWLHSLPTLPAVCGFSAMELKQGCKDLRELRTVENFLTPFEIVWAHQEDLDRALGTYFRFALSHGVGVLDLLIATTALGRHEVVATFNVKHFRAIPDLQIVQPYQRA
jgi:predicted nucleic acid-binding protein